MGSSGAQLRAPATLQRLAIMQWRTRSHQAWYQHQRLEPRGTPAQPKQQQQQQQQRTHSWPLSFNPQV